MNRRIAAVIAATKVHVRAHTDARFIVGLSTDGTWRLHRVASWAEPEDGAETECGHGGARWFVEADWLPDMDDWQTVCEWCFGDGRDDAQRRAFLAWANQPVGERNCCQEV